MIVGGINWGLVGLFQFDFVGWLLGGSASIWSRIVFTLVGIAALCGIPGLFADESSEKLKAASPSPSLLRKIHLSQRERPWHKDAPFVDCQRLPLWGAVEQRETERRAR